MQRNSRPVEELRCWTERFEADPEVRVADQTKDLRGHLQELSRMGTRRADKREHSEVVRDEEIVKRRPVRQNAHCCHREDDGENVRDQIPTESVMSLPAYRW